LGKERKYGLQETKKKVSVKQWLRPVLIVLVLAVVIFLGRAFDAPAKLQQVLEWIQGLGWLGVAVFFLLYIVACVLFLPGSILTLGAGFVYGVVEGTIIVSISSTVGATVAFLVGRYVARDWVAAKIAGNPKFESMDAAIGREGWKIVGLTRLSPVFPFNLLNYAYGLTRVSLPQYFLASWIGMLPGTVMYVYLGSLASSLAAVAAETERQGKTPLEWTIYAVGLIATIAVTVYITKIARRALSQKIEAEPEGSAA